MTKATNGPVDPTRDSQHEASGGPRREPDRLIRLLESWEHVNSDITKTVESQAALPPEEDPIEAIEGLVRFSLPALCRRICELGANASNAQPGISAEIMVCRENDSKEQVLRAVVYDAFPSYSLDRVISFRSGFWSPHIRSVHYGKPDDKALNRDVIAKALLVGRDLIEDVVQESSTSLESEGGVLSVYSILPPSLLKARALRSIRPGTILAMTLRLLQRGGVRAGSHHDTGGQARDAEVSPRHSLWPLDRPPVGEGQGERHRRCLRGPDQRWAGILSDRARKGLHGAECRPRPPHPEARNASLLIQEDGAGRAALATRRQSTLSGFWRRPNKLRSHFARR